MTKYYHAFRLYKTEHWKYSLPLRLLGQLLLPGLGLHLLHVDGVGLAATHVELVVAHAQSQDALVHAHARSKEHEVWRLLVDRLDYELAVVE